MKIKRVLRYQRNVIGIRAMYCEARDKASGSGCGKKTRRTHTSPVVEVVIETKKSGEKTHPDIVLVLLYDMKT